MAASTVAGGLFNAVAFAGAGFLFAKLNHQGYEQEIKRHNKAIEKLAKAKEAWYEREVRRKDRITQLRIEISDANKDLAVTNKALKELAEVSKASQVDRQPTIHDYYEPSDEMKKYQDATIGAVGLASGAALVKFLGLSV